MTDNAGGSLQRKIEIALAEAWRRQEKWLAALPEGWFGFGEVRHDPPWHIYRGAWQGSKDVQRGDYSFMVSLCGKELGRQKRRVTPDDDLCSFCVAAADVIVRERAV